MTCFVSTKPAPLFNTPFLSQTALPFDEENLVRRLEMVALPGTCFRVVKKHPSSILEVTTPDYPSHAPLFVDFRFGSTRQTFLERDKTFPPKEAIIKRLKEKIGTPYVWGGNISAGIPEMLTYYPPQKKLTPFEEIHWTCKGVDCSGLLYEATDGATARNSQDLLFCAAPLLTEGLSYQEIKALLKPLDLILWKGHVVIVLDKDHVIESKHEWGGVTVTPIIKRLELEKKTPTSSPQEVLENKGAFLVGRLVI